jgi:hypothetical protein
MTTALCDEPKIISLANELGIHEGDRVEGILDYCRRKVQALLKGAKAVRSIDDLEALICEKLQITIIEVRNDADIAAVTEKYARQEKEPAFAGIRNELTEDTFATLLQRKRRAGDQNFRYVAVIDCRGQKGARRFFSRWHEIAHVLTTVSQLELSLHRSTNKKDACETMMDMIAAEFGFYGPLFAPLLERECATAGGLTFKVVENVRREFCPKASLEATLNACSSRLPNPLIVLQAAMGYKKAEQDALASSQTEMFAVEKPVPQLRVTKVMPNAAARARRLKIHKNMRVPASSVITLASRESEGHRPLRAKENLNLWRTSEGGALCHASVQVEAVHDRDRVWAIIQAPAGK